ncbi:unnamed protein product [Discula destructiva]
MVPLAAAVLPAVMARPNGAIFQRGGGKGGHEGGFGGCSGGGQASGVAPSFTSEAVPAYTSAAAASTVDVAQAQATGGSGSGYASSPAATATGSSGSSSGSTGSSGGSGSGTAISALAGGSGVGGTTCTVTAAADASASAGSCSNILLQDVTVAASEGLTVTVPSGGALLFGGTMTVEYTPDADYTPIVLSGSNVKVAGLAGAVIDGQGAKYWDGEGSNGGSDKPDKFISLHDVDTMTFEQLTIQNWPTHLFSLSGTDLTINNLILDNSAGDELDSDGDTLGHNSDAFDVSSMTGLHVYDVTVYNQDDCVAVNDGANMLFENMYCSGGHGLSIGSIKTGKTVSNVTFQDSSVVNSANGCRIKTYDDATDASVSDITYSGITLSGITDYAIDVQQDYENGSPTGEPGSSVTVSGITFQDITGTTSGDDAYNYYVLCGDGSCTDFTWSGIDITGGQTSCAPSGSICPTV